MSSDEAQEAPEGKSRRRVLLFVVQLVVVGGLFAWVVHSIVDDARELDWSNLIREPIWVLAAIALWGVAFMFRAWLWGEMMRRIGYEVGGVDGARVFLASHLGRFLPGKMWSVVGAGVFGRHLGLPVKGSAVAMTMFLIIYYMVGSLAALLVIWQLGEAQVWVAISITVAGLAVLGFLASKWFPMLLRWLGRKFGRDMSDLKLPTPSVLAMVGVGLALVWIAAGAAYALMIRGVVPPQVGVVDVVTGIGTYASSLVAGFAALFAPSGLGVREAVMLALLQPSIGGAYGGIVAITARVIMTTMELPLSLWGAWPYLMARRREKKTAGTAAT